MGASLGHFKHFFITIIYQLTTSNIQPQIKKFEISSTILRNNFLKLKWNPRKRRKNIKKRVDLSPPAIPSQMWHFRPRHCQCVLVDLHFDSVFFKYGKSRSEKYYESEFERFWLFCVSATQCWVITHIYVYMHIIYECL